MQTPAKIYKHSVGTATSCHTAPALAAISPAYRSRADHGGSTLKAKGAWEVQINVILLCNRKAVKKRPPLLTACSQGTRCSHYLRENIVFPDQLMLSIQEGPGVKTWCLVFGSGQSFNTSTVSAFSS